MKTIGRDKLNFELVVGILLAVLMGATYQVASALEPRDKTTLPLNPAEQLGVMLQLDNMLEKMPHHVWGNRRGEIDRQFALLEHAGVKWCRVGVQWEMIQPRPNQWQWAAADYVVECAHKHHVNLVWLVGNTAPWDSRNKDWNGVPNDLHKANGHFSIFVHKLAERYKGKINYWEIRNEPNLEYMWHGNEKDYVAYLQAAHRAVKNVDPQSHVVLGGLGGGLGEQLKYFRALVSQARKQSAQLPFDIADFHVYPGEADNHGFKGPGCVQKYMHSWEVHVDEIMTALRLPDMPVWFTEFDYPADPKEQPDPGYKGPEGQARVLQEIFPLLVQGHRHRKIFWASLLDDYNDPGFHYMGLVASDKGYHIKQERPAYHALQKLMGSASH